MYVVTVDFQVKPEHLDAFTRAVLTNARLSLEEEAACRQFDVMRAENDPAHIFLYERYDDKDAFAAHLSREHFKEFDALSAPWLLGKRVQTFFSA